MSYQVVCFWAGLEACDKPAVRFRADRANHWWIAACAEHCADAPPEDLAPEGEWLLPQNDP